MAAFQTVAIALSLAPLAWGIGHHLFGRPL